MGSLASPLEQQTASTNGVPPHAMPLISPLSLLSTYLTQSSDQDSQPRRPSGRAPLEPNKIHLNTSALTHTHGSSVVRIGSTTIVCGVRAEILNVADIPSWSVRDAVGRTVGEWEAAESGRTVDDGGAEEEEDRDRVLGDYNLLVPNLSLDTGCSPLHPANAPPSQEQMNVTQRVLSLLLGSKFVDVRDLEIYDEGAEDNEAAVDEGEDSMVVDDAQDDVGQNTTRTIKHTTRSTSTWSVYPTEAAVERSSTQHARWDRDQGRVVCSSDTSQMRRLTLRGMPVPLSFGVCVLDRRVLDVLRRRDPNEQTEGSANGPKGHKLEDAVLLVDLEGIEEECCPETGCVVVDYGKGSGDTELVRIEKSGGSHVGVEQLTRVVDVCQQRWKDWHVLMSTL
ncbi:uncharacterized protein AB675_9114 [Cyphellophora attinorum]|uniref:Ribosomal RNA-processing protein 43 n=1 Tax=Cyphellophora attinorum TaxID=1664694 RepID=A0A0N1H646_9EURO|nr:uncharacterized protein AB675_9114 [Phialophora attinorum]KPI41435.1 hypothetical protein AB675_9114 [Phialophora attinorum]